jgi:4-methylaminobutanoate oxidase (formaldehyde-forming)
MNVPSRTDVIVVGGGIIGCSIAYHLTKLGIRDVLLLERRQLCCGTTWHSVGSVAELRGTRRMTELARYTAELYRSLEAETGQATGYKKTGSITLALTRERVMEMERTAILARAFGQEAGMISIAEVRRRCEQIVTEDALAAFYLPSDGRTNPVDTTQALAKGARLGGAKIMENVTVTALDVADGRVRGVMTDHGPVRSDAVVLATGMWSRDFAAPYGVRLPLQAAEHFYAVTENVEGLQRNMPFVRVPDESSYYKEDAGKLLFGCLEKVAKPWGLDGIPADFCFDSLPSDLDHFEPTLAAALKRFPLLETTGIKLFFNGPESFTPDGNALMGETPEVRDLFVACGLNTVGVMSGGAMGKMVAAWVHDRRRPEGFAEFDVARLSPFQSGRGYLRDRITEAVGVLYEIGWPNREYLSGRGGRLGPLHPIHSAANAVWGSRAGWEVPLFYAPEAERRELLCSFDKQNSVPWVAAECRAARERAALFDLSADAKIEVCGPDALRALGRLSATSLGEGMSNSLWLTERGGVRASVGVMMLDTQRALILSAPGSERQHIQWLRRHTDNLPPEVIRDVTSSYAGLLLLGPHAENLLREAGARPPKDGVVAKAEIGYAPVFLAMTKIGNLVGWMIVVPTEFAAHAAGLLTSSGGGATFAGLYALESLRIGAAQPGWPSELGDNVTPREAGISSTIDFGRHEFVGRDAAFQAGAEGAVSTRLVRVVLTQDRGAMYGQEGILRNGSCVGLTTSATWCAVAGAPVALGYVSDERGIEAAWFEGASFEIEMAGGVAAASCELVGG